MQSGAVKRIRRTRPGKATPALSLDDDEFWEIPPWDNDKRDTTSTDQIAEAGASNDVTKIASAISRRWYPLTSNSRWPESFASRATAMKKDCREAFRVALALTVALTTQLIGRLTDLELKIMLFILNRTWNWKKPREGIPASQFLGGVFHKGIQIQAPIASSPDHLHRACEQLERKGLIRITSALCNHGYVNVFEIDVGKAIQMADSIQRTARKQPSRREKLRERLR